MNRQENAAPKLIVVTDTTVLPELELVSAVERLVHAAAPSTVMVQLRDVALSAQRRLALGASLSSVCRRAEQWFVVNDRLDLAVLLGADGVHLGERGVSTTDARALLPPSAWVSRAVHGVDSAVSSDADAVLLSPVMAARKGNPELGLGAVSAARRAIDVAKGPLLYALGGVNAANAADCVAAGADGVAAIGAALVGDPDALLDALGIRRT